METPLSAKPDTYFAPAGRVGPLDLDQQRSACLGSPVTRAILEAVDGYVVVLNEQRQILAANPLLMEILDSSVNGRCPGMRPGEALSCVHATEGPDGCGTSQACSGCGAVLAILAAQSGQEPSARECYLSRKRDGLWESCVFQVRATPLHIGEHHLVALVLHNITAEKRRESLERIFLHDLLNTLQGLKGWTEFLQSPGHDPRKAAERILQLSEQLAQDVAYQRMVVQAEHGELIPHVEPVLVQDLLRDVEESLVGHVCARLRHLKVCPVAEHETLNTDARFLSRILINMGVNALEATDPGGSVRVWFERHTGQAGFYVHNPATIPEPVKPRIFQQGFSTKGAAGRGLGTYAMKLLGENILKGEVGFSSSPFRGTSFHILWRA